MIFNIKDHDRIYIHGRDMTFVSVPKAPLKVGDMLALTEKRHFQLREMLNASN